jgi:hypothetical protein
VSYCEIYEEKVFDLLDRANAERPIELWPRVQVRWGVNIELWPRVQARWGGKQGEDKEERQRAPHSPNPPPPALTIRSGKGQTASFTSGCGPSPRGPSRMC